MAKLDKYFILSPLGSSKIVMNFSQKEFSKMRSKFFFSSEKFRILSNSSYIFLFGKSSKVFAFIGLKSLIEKIISLFLSNAFKKIWVFLK